MNLSHAVRYVLDKCGNVEETSRALSEMRHATANNFLLLLADREGNIAVVEMTPSKVRIRELDEGNDSIVYTNYFSHPDMLEMSSSRASPPCS
jgi:predicted choloylglycine hydrolase